MNELKLYSLITAEFVENGSDSNRRYRYAADYAQPVDGQDLLDFQDTIEPAKKKSIGK